MLLSGFSAAKDKSEYNRNNIYMTRSEINDTFLFQSGVKVKVVGEVSEK